MGTTPSNPALAKKGFIGWVIRNPALSALGTLGGIISIPLAIYLYLMGVEHHGLSIYVNPVKSVIVKAGQSSDLHVLYKNQQLTSDVTALQVAIWNNGKKSIRSEDVLEPIILETSEKRPILEASIRHISRPVIHAQLDSGLESSGKIGVRWKILEHNDGLIIQLIIAGSTTISTIISGTVEGQPSGIKTYKAGGERLGNIGRVIIYILLIMVPGSLSFWKVPHIWERNLLRAGIYIFVMSGIIVACSTILLSWLFPSTPNIPIRFD